MQRTILASLIATSTLLSSGVMAQGISPYLPLNMAPEIEAQIERAMALTPSAPLTKPYKAKELLDRIEHIKESHPELYRRLNSYLARYKKTVVVNHLAADLSLSNSTNKSMPNQRGVSVENNYTLSGSVYAFVNPYLYGSVGAQYSDDEGFTHTNTHVGFGFEYAQVEIGYREHWFSPFQDGAMLVSTNAEPETSITISNTTPITDWDFRYEIFYSKLAKVEGIRLGDEVFPGNPRHAGIHLSFAPLDNWTIGFNRTMQFGGGKREVGFRDILEAIFNPAGKDNVDGSDGTDPNYEFGNQQASITSKLNVDWGMPLSLYAEYGGEDTTNRSNFSLGNATMSFGVYAPFVTKDMSLRYEFSDWSSRWYIHHLYQQGYTNNGNVLGHWGGDNRLFGDDTPANTHSINLNWDIADNQLLDVTLRAIHNKDNTRFNYQNAYELQAEYSYATSNGFYGIGIYAGKDVFGDSFSKLSGYYRW